MVLDNILSVWSAVLPTGVMGGLGPGEDDSRDWPMGCVAVDTGLSSAITAENTSVL